MNGEILAIGTELLMGEIVDTNSAFIAQRAPAFGIEIRHVTLVGDNLDDMVDSVNRGMRRSNILFITGGLGPTDDDLTREAIAKSLGEELRLDPEILEQIRTYIEGRGGVMPPSNAKQASITSSVTILPNSRGTAPGWWAEKDSCVVVAMPGVPGEMELMWSSEVVPRLRKFSTDSVILSRTLKTFALSESAVGEKVSHLFGLENPYLGIYARPDGIQLRMISKGKNEAEALSALAQVEEEIRNNLASNIWGVDDETLEQRVGSMLMERGLTLAIMESCTGGLLSSSITDIPGSSQYFQGGVVSYLEQAKVSFGVGQDIIENFGIVSSQVAESMAQRVRDQFHSDIGIGITGVAGPEPLGGVEVGNVYIGIASRQAVSSTHHRLPPNRALIKRRAVVLSLLEICKLFQNDQ